MNSSMRFITGSLVAVVAAMVAGVSVTAQTPAVKITEDNLLRLPRPKAIAISVIISQLLTEDIYSKRC